MTARLFLAAMILLLSAMGAGADVFLADDPVSVDRDTLNIPEPQPIPLSMYYEFVDDTFLHPGDPRPASAQNVNTLGEVPDSSWYTNRHYRHRMSIAELTRGPNRSEGPVQGKPWTVVGGKSEGIMPGLTIVDGNGVRYLLKFDPKSNPEMATGAEIVCTKFFHALGYNTPENYLVHFGPEQLKIDPEATIKNRVGRMKPLTRKRLKALLALAPQDEQGRFRAVASKFLPGKSMGHFRFVGTRPDDGNDIFLHEHRRELRGYRVSAAWLNHDDSRAINTLDMFVEEDGRRFLRHYLIDFGSTLGSASVAPESRRSGNEYKFEARPMLASMATLGLWLRPWVGVYFPHYPSIGRLEADYFDPTRWKPEYPNPAFRRMDADDAFWAAKQVANFTDEEIRAVVGTAEYSNPEAAAYLVETLAKRRDKVARAYLPYGGGLDRFEVRDGNALVFEDLLDEYGVRKDHPRRTLTWNVFTNRTGETRQVLAEEETDALQVRIPDSPSQYLVLTIVTPQVGTTRVFVKKTGAGFEVVGIGRESPASAAPVRSR